MNSFFRLILGLFAGLVFRHFNGLTITETIIISLLFAIWLYDPDYDKPSWIKKEEEKCPKN